MDYKIKVNFKNGKQRLHTRKYLKYGCIKNWLDKRYFISKRITDNKFKYQYRGLRSNVAKITVLGLGNAPVGNYIGGCNYKNGL